MVAHDSFENLIATVSPIAKIVPIVAKSDLPKPDHDIGLKESAINELNR